VNLKVKEKFKSKAVTSMNTPSQIIQEEIQKTQIFDAPYVPSTSAIKMTINRARTQEHPKLPSHFKELEIPDIHKNFLLAHYTSEGECILLFGTDENIQLLNQSTFWIADGTFKTCPKLFYQIYTVHGMIGVHETEQKVVSLVYGLMSGKSEHNYFMYYELINLPLKK
jgi:hypothetical protein